MRKLLLVIVVSAVTLLTVAPPARGLITVNGAGSADTISPQVIDSSPERGEELPLDGGITFYFDQPMDAPSVQSALRSTVPGTWQWSDQTTAIFKPSTTLQRNTLYTFILGVEAKSSSGAPLRVSSRCGCGPLAICR
jgi:hypothetical protein